MSKGFYSIYRRYNYLLGPNLRIVLCQSGKKYSFDAISFNYFFPSQIESFRSSEKPVIIGGGATGVELALSTLAWRKKINKIKMLP
jgi:hypothetical protein